MKKTLLIVGLIVMIVLGVVIKIYKGDNKYVYIKEMDGMEEYTENVVYGLMEEFNSKNAIKAVSVVIRSCYVYGVVTGEESFTHELEKHYGQDKNREEKFKRKIKKLVRETKGEVITYDNTVILPFFHIISPLKTRCTNDNSKKDIPYLKKLECNEDVEAEEFIQIKYFNKEDILRLLSAELPEIESIKGELSIGEKDELGYVSKVKLDNKYDLDVNGVVSKLKLNSCNFTIGKVSNNENLIRIACKGKGSGMGMSIYNAYRLSKKDISYIDIVKHYYKNIEIKKVYY